MIRQTVGARRRRDRERAAGHRERPDERSGHVQHGPLGAGSPTIVAMNGSLGQRNWRYRTLTSGFTEDSPPTTEVAGVDGVPHGQRGRKEDDDRRAHRRGKGQDVELDGRVGEHADDDWRRLPERGQSRRIGVQAREERVWLLAGAQRAERQREKRGGEETHPHRTQTLHGSSPNRIARGFSPAAGTGTAGVMGGMQLHEAPSPSPSIYAS